VDLQAPVKVRLRRNWEMCSQFDNVRQLRNSLRNVAFKIFLLECPYELCVTRFLSRTEHPNLHEVTIENLANHKYKWDYLRENELPEAIRIDATREPQVVFDEVFGYIQG
jgi:thymidylate kinase